MSLNQRCHKTNDNATLTPFRSVNKAILDGSVIMLYVNNGHKILFT